MGAGMLADNSRRWYRSLELLRRDGQFRSELAGRGYEVAAGLKLRDHAWRWLEAWDTALRLQRGQTSTVSVHA
jgi:hypothetical protein